jgi:hypothetical protein
VAAVNAEDRVVGYAATTSGYVKSDTGGFCWRFGQRRRLSLYVAQSAGLPATGAEIVSTLEIKSFDIFPRCTF